MQKEAHSANIYSTKWQCCRTPYLPIVCRHSVWGACTTLWPGVVGLVQWALLTRRDGLLEVEVRGVEQDLIPYVGQLAFPNIPMEDGSLTLMNMAPLMVLKMVCASLPTMEKLSNLV